MGDDEEPVTVTVSGTFDAGSSSNPSFAVRQGLGMTLGR